MTNPADSDQHLLLACGRHFQLDEPGCGGEGYHVHRLAGSLGKIFHDREEHAVVDVGRQDQRAIEEFLSSVGVGLAFNLVRPGGALQ